MHSAVWSQPVTSNRKFRTHSSTDQSPDSTAGKFVLGVSIAEVLLGGLLCVLGLTGFFVRDDNKKYLGMAGLSGFVSMVTGVSGCRAVSGWDRAKSCTNVFTGLSFVNSLSCLLVTVMAVIIVMSSPELLLTTVIAVSEAVLGFIGFLLSLAAFVTAIVARSVLRNPLGAESARAAKNRKPRES